MQYIAKCPMVKALKPLGCLLNRLKHDTCESCPGIEGWKAEIMNVRAKLAAIMPEPEPASFVVPAKELNGLLVPVLPAKIEELERRGVYADEVAEMLDLYLAGKLCQLVPGEDPFKKSFASMIRPEG